MALPLMVAGCGGGSSSRPCATLTLTDMGVSPPVSCAGGTTVTFVYNNTTPRLIKSNPHNLHTDCPELNDPKDATGRLGGDRFTATMGSGPKVCGFHDHWGNDTNPAFRGTITVTTASAGGGGGPGY